MALVSVTVVVVFDVRERISHIKMSRLSPKLMLHFKIDKIAESVWRNNFLARKDWIA